MKILKQEKNGNRYKFEIETDFASFKEARDEVVDSYSKELKIPGFRPGKAPKNLIEKNLNTEVINDRASQHLISKLYPELISQEKIDPIDYPNVEILNLKENESFTFKLEVEVYPEIKLGKYKGLKIKKKSDAVSEEDILSVLGNLQNRFAKHIEVTDSSTQKDDVIDLEIQAEADGAQIKRWPRDLEHFPVGHGYISPEFDSSIIGMNINEEKNFPISFPNDYKIPEIAGKEVSFKIKIKKIERLKLSPLDDEFSKTVSSFGTLSELKEEIKKNLEAERKEEAESDLKNQLVEAASNDAELNMPETLTRMETDIMLDELKASLSRSNLTIDDYMKALKKNEDGIKTDLKPQAELRAKSKIVLKKIAEVENLDVLPHDLDTEIALMAQGSDKSVEEYKKSLGHGGIAYISDHILRKKALDFLTNHAEIN